MTPFVAMRIDILLDVLVDIFLSLLMLEILLCLGRSVESVSSPYLIDHSY